MLYTYATICILFFLRVKLKKLQIFFNEKLFFFNFELKLLDFTHRNATYAFISFHYGEQTKRMHYLT